LSVMGRFPGAEKNTRRRRTNQTLVGYFSSKEPIIAR
jgi:hypothetical protein